MDLSPEDPVAAVLARAADTVLARPPRVPLFPDRFASNTLFGQPGIYPEGSPMVPAEGATATDIEAKLRLTMVLQAADTDPDEVDRARARFDDPELVAIVPDAGVRAALGMLAVTVAAPLVDAFPQRTAARSLCYGEPASPGRVVGPSADPTASDPDRVVNRRYGAEHPGLVSPSLAHDLLWEPSMTGHAAETLLHALVAMVHCQLVAAVPQLARTGTELSRRQNSLAITLLNSRSPGSSRITLCAPDGPGTIPGGAPSMQTTDFWSVPFGPIADDDASPLVAEVLSGIIADDVALPDPLRFDEALGPWLDAHLRDDWLPCRDHVRVSVALGLVDPSDIATEADVPVAEVRRAFGLRDPADDVPA